MGFLSLSLLLFQCTYARVEVVMGMPMSGSQVLPILTGSMMTGLKLAGTLKPSGTSSSLTTAVVQVTFNAATFPDPVVSSGHDASDRKGPIPRSCMMRATGNTLILKVSGPGAASDTGTITLADGIWTPAPLFMTNLWLGKEQWFVSSGGTCAIEYVIGYEIV